MDEAQAFGAKKTSEVKNLGWCFHSDMNLLCDLLQSLNFWVLILPQYSQSFVIGFDFQFKEDELNLY